MEQFTEKEIKEGLRKAYKEAGHNAYFGEGFRAGIEFANQGQNLPISPVVVPKGTLCKHTDEYGNDVKKYLTEINEWYCPNCRQLA